MAKYRIVHVKIPQLSICDGTADFIPKIQYRNEYHVEYLEELFFGLISRWNKLGNFNSLARAEKQIKFYKEKETCKVVKIY